MKKFHSLLMILALLVSCKSDFFIDIENPQNQETNFPGLVLSTDETQVSGATVSIGTATVQTSYQGIFVIKSADVKENFAYVKVRKAVFVNGSRTDFYRSTSPNIPAKQLIINLLSPAVSIFSIIQENMLGVLGSFSTDYSFEFSGGYFNLSIGNIQTEIIHSLLQVMC